MNKRLKISLFGLVGLMVVIGFSWLIISLIRQSQNPDATANVDLTETSNSSEADNRLDSTDQSIDNTDNPGQSSKNPAQNGNTNKKDSTSKKPATGSSSSNNNNSAPAKPGNSNNPSSPSKPPTPPKKETISAVVSNDGKRCTYVVTKNEPVAITKGGQCTNIKDTFFTPFMSPFREGTHYRVTASTGHNPSMASLAIHGGGIERGTDQLAASFAQQTGSAYYIFDSLLTQDNSKIHLTSTQFDDVRALKVVAPATTVVSWHGADDKPAGQAHTWIGGSDTAARSAIMKRLKAAGFGATIASQDRPEIAGEKPTNIANRNKTSRGVQLELSTTQRMRFFVNNDWSRANRNNPAKRTAAFDRYVKAVRAGLQDIKR